MSPKALFEVVYQKMVFMLRRVPAVNSVSASSIKLQLL